MANQDFDLTGALKVRPAEEDDAAHLHAYCFPEQTKTQVTKELEADLEADNGCLLYTSPSPRDRTRSRMPSSA